MVTRDQAIERMLSNLEARVKWEADDDAAGGRAGPAWENRPDAVYCRGYRDGLARRIPSQLQAAYDEARSQLQREADPDYQTYLRLKTKFERK